MRRSTSNELVAVGDHIEAFDAVIDEHEGAGLVEASAYRDFANGRRDLIAGKVNWRAPHSAWVKVWVFWIGARETFRDRLHG